MTHPLTDDECKRIAACYPYNGVDIEDCGHIHDMRAAYDLAIEHAVDWLECNAGICDDDEGYIYLEEDCFSETSINVDLLVADLKKAMRPQENNS